MRASGSLSFYLTSCISGHNTATEHTETFEKQPLKTLFLCDLCGKKDFRKRSTISIGIREISWLIPFWLTVRHSRIKLTQESRGQCRQQARLAKPGGRGQAAIGFEGQRIRHPRIPRVRGCRIRCPSKPIAAW